MYPIKPFTRIRAALLFTPSILFIMLGLIFVLPNATLAQESNGVDKIEAISKRLEELQRQIETLKRENDELKKKFEERDTSKQALAAEKEKPTAEVRETPIAQQEVEPQKKEKRIEFGGQIRLRPELRYNDLNSFTKDVDFFVSQRARLHINAKLADDVTGFLEFQDSRLWGAENSTDFSIQNVDLHQAYLNIDHFLTDPLSLRVGRQELSYGDERLVGSFDWDNVGRSFDAIKAVYTRKNWSADIFAARVIDIHGRFFFFTEPEEDEGLFPVLPHQEFYGAYLKFLNNNPKHKIEAYGLILRDTFSRFGEFGRRQATTIIYTAGARQEGKFDGGFYYDGEVAFQTGHSGPDDHRALALAAKLGKSFNSARSPHFGFEYDFATGDGDSRDHKSREFIDLFPNNHIHYGYMDFLGWRNMHDFRLNFGFNPANKLSFDADYHKFLLHKAGGRWSNAAGITLGFDRNGASSREIGQELDFTLQFPYRDRLKFLTGYSLFLPGRFAKLRTFSTWSHFSYIQTQINF